MNSELIRPSMATIFQDPFSEEVWKTTYKDYKDSDVNDTFWRVARSIASVEETPAKKQEWAEKFFEMLTDFKVVPGGRILSNAGTDFKGTSLINCFVGPHPKKDLDSLEGIFEMLTWQAKTLKSEGGWGHNFSILRPRGSFIEGIGVETPGSVKFMELFDKSSDIITSGSGKNSDNKKAKGKIRKGAMMGVLDCWHPDIIEFVTAKQTANRLSKFNVSVNCTDEFMEKVVFVHDLKRNNETQDVVDQVTWDLEFPDTDHSKYRSEWHGNLRAWKEKGYPTRVYRTVSVEWLWNLITQSTYNRNEPGILFLDRANYFNQLNYFETIYATNPCGEQTLAPGSICCLGSMNLTQFINARRTGFDLEKVKKYAGYLVRFLDNVNSYSHAPLPEYIDAMRKKRRIGCGLMGWGSALLMLKVKFGSKQADKLRTEVLKAFTHAGVQASIDIAKEKGMFEYCVPEKHAQSPYWKNIDLPEYLLEEIRKVGIRNSSLFSIQPNGNSSIFANVVTGGLEPCFMHEYIRTVIVRATPDYISHSTPRWFEGEFVETDMFKFVYEGDEKILRGTAPDGVVYKIDQNRGLTKEVLCQDYGVRFLSERGEWDPTADWASNTTNLTVEDHISDMKGFAQWVDSALSKTINLPNDYSFDAFQNVYLDAYKTGFIKGITTYRAGTMTSVLSAVEQKDAVDEEEVVLADVKLSDSNPAVMKVLRDYEHGGGRKWYVTVVMNENNAPVALFVQTNAIEKSVTATGATERLFAMARLKGIPEKHIETTEKKCENDSNSIKIARAISLLLRHGVRIKNIVAELDKVEGVTFSSFLFHVKKFLSTYIKDGEKVEGVSCSNCSSTRIVYSEGCQKCLDCGSGKCS